jgi:hypothetical protein
MSHVLQDLRHFKESYDARAYAAGQRCRQHVHEFFQPIVIRWRQRKLCFSCGDKATRKCRTHGSKLCDSAFCRMEHRRIKSAVSGSLLRPFCEFPEPTSWQTHLLRTAVALAVGLAVMAVVAL